MLFTSYTFIFGFLPLLCLCWWICSIWAPARLPLLLLGASLLFYGLWGLPFLALLLLMICINYFIGCWLAASATNTEQSVRKKLLTCAIILNLLPLCWFKYAHFFVININMLLHSNIAVPQTGLPLGISFYTFLQIAWLVTVYRGNVQPQGFLRYTLFASCFPYVISGPIVRYEQIGPQFAQLRMPNSHDVAAALSIFVLGLGKKVLLADTLAMWANSIFTAAERGYPLSAGEAWVGSLAYTFQLYFDFSGYTDMAMGIALFMGLRIPDNFNSPYKSTGIVDFWRRWHITLSTWLKDFLYIPLGGSRQGTLRQYRNLFLTMLIGGAWHGAGWPFIVWGAMHETMLCINHFFRAWSKKNTAYERILHMKITRIISILLTFLCINAAWVVFRATSIHGAMRIYEGMWQGMTGGLCAPWTELFPNHYVQGAQPLFLLGLCAAIVWFLPNARQMVFGDAQSPPWLRIYPSECWACCLALIAFASCITLSRQSVFLYFQF